MTTLTLSNESIRCAFDKFQASLSTELKERLNGRLERGLAFAQRGVVARHPGQDNPHSRLYKVNSSDPTKPPYLVDLVARTCTCPDHWKGHYCKHRIAAQIVEFATHMEQEMQKARSARPAAPASHMNAVREAAPAPVEAQPEGPAQDALQGEAIIWAIVKHEDQNVGVEVLSLEDDLALVRALPVIKEGSKLQPSFPFDGGKSSLGTFPYKELFHVKIFRHLA